MNEKLKREYYNIRASFFVPTFRSFYAAHFIFGHCRFFLPVYPFWLGEPKCWSTGNIVRTGSLRKHKKMKHRNFFCKSCKEWAYLYFILIGTVKKNVFWTVFCIRFDGIPSQIQALFWNRIRTQVYRCLLNPDTDTDQNLKIKSEKSVVLVVGRKIFNFVHLEDRLRMSGEASRENTGLFKSSCSS